MPLGNETLLDWAATAHKPLAGQVVFYETAPAGVARESIGFAAGQCVAYEEAFASGDGEAGAYTCTLVVTAPAFELLVGGGPAAAAVRAVRASPVAAVAAAAAPLAAKLAAAAIGGGPKPAAPLVPEYSYDEFKKTMVGAKHVAPESIIEEIYRLFNAASAASVPGKPSIPDWKKVEELVCSTYYIDPDEPDPAKATKKLNGHWPPANGGYQRQMVQLKEGDVFDRYQGGVVDSKVDPADPTKRVDLVAGDEFAVTFIGTFMSPVGQAGTPNVPQSFESRALDRPEQQYPFAYTITILQDVPLDMVQGELAQVIPWYGQPGGGTQMRVEFTEDWWRKEWSTMQGEGYAKIELTSSPDGKYEVLPNNRAKKLK